VLENTVRHHEDDMHRFDGANDLEASVWHTFVRIALDNARRIGDKRPSTEALVVDDGRYVWPEEARVAIQALLFSAFLLEARLKRVLQQMGRPPSARDGLDAVIKTFWSKLAHVPKISGVGMCSQPPEWALIEADLQQLRQLRNSMAHGNLERVRADLPSDRAPEVALRMYNSVVQAIALVNIGTGYESETPSAVLSRFSMLHVDPR
jgi:hypothetical protein